MNRFNRLLILVIFCSFTLNAFAAEKSNGLIYTGKGIAADRAKGENKVLPDYLFVTLYKPNYVLPYYFTGSPDNKVYSNNTPGNEQIRHSEFKYQLSLKVPLWKNIFNHPSSLYFGYTQLSYWQLYTRKTFIRETDYEPELFLANELNKGFNVFNNKWHLNFVNPGITHQSNGIGTSLQRSWNRIYVDLIASTDNLMVSVKPWYVISTNGNNKNIAKYLGYGRVLVSYKLHKQVLSAQAYSILEHGVRYASAEVTWSFPISKYVKGYMQVFSGYGQSLVEYNHRTNSVGVGVSLNDWIS